MTNRSLCIHAHFYQPPREDPITGQVPPEHGASPHHNWNEKIHDECYRPNAELGNFERISFNVGPTLFEWMQSAHPDTCAQITAQDRANLERFGVGNAMAQSYNHTILPLASLQDKVTQVRWGIADFRHRFGRIPEGMWLPETAVDLETLDVLADQGIQFTILAPWQANCGDLDTGEPYTVRLSGGRSITVFFYNRELSTRVSFDAESTSNADRFAAENVSRHFRRGASEPELVMIASDGELYGHHQKFRDRFLERLVDGASSGIEITPTYPALWLKQHPPRRTIEIVERTSWSCHHGITRWSDECGCTSGSGKWKHHLRLAFDRLSDALNSVYLEFLGPRFREPWELRNRYIHVVLGEMTITELLSEFCGEQTLPTEYTRRIQLLLEAQRACQRAFTSCGWYFEDFSRIEPRLVVTYAAQAVSLVRRSTGIDLAPQVSAYLRHIESSRGRLRGDIFFNRQLERMG